MKTNRHCFSLDLKNDSELISAYKAHHKNVWPDIIKSIKDNGILSLDIYLVENRLFMIMEVSDAFSFENKNNFQFLIYKNKLNNFENFVIKMGKFNVKNSVRVRVISTNIKFSKLILKNSNVKKSLKYLSKYSNFALIVINTEKNKIENDNTTLRYYGIGAQIIKDLKVKNMILVTKKKKKIIGLEGFGLKITKQEIFK